MRAIVRALLATGGQAQAVTQDERAAWFALAMNAAAYIEDAANCLRDSDAKQSANGAVNHVREQCNALWDSAPQAQADARDAAFEAVRQKFCKLQRYSFFLNDKGNVRRTPDYCGNWVEFEAVHTLFEPGSVDAAIMAAKGNEK